SEAQGAAGKDKRYTQTAEAAESERNDLAPKLAFLVVSVEHGDNATVKVGDREVDRVALGSAIPVMPGNATVVVSVAGAEVARQAVTLGSSERKTVVLDARPKPPEVAAPVEQPREPPLVAIDSSSPGGLRTAAYVAGGIGVAGFAAFGIFGAL